MNVLAMKEAMDNLIELGLEDAEVMIVTQPNYPLELVSTSVLYMDAEEGEEVTYKVWVTADGSGYAPHDIFESDDYSEAI